MNSFSSDIDLINIGTHGIRIFLLLLPVIGFQITSANFFQAIGKALISMVLSMMRQVILLIPLLLILPHFLGLNGIWYASPVSDIIASILTAILLVRELRKMEVIRAQE